MHGTWMLFEPQTVRQNVKVAIIAKTILSSYLYPYIGVTDRFEEGVYAYNSDNRPVMFQPAWFRKVARFNYDCIRITLDQDLGQWIDGPCSDKRTSICELKSKKFLAFNSNYIKIENCITYFISF